jgi:hypothetical protein
MNNDERIWQEACEKVGVWSDYCSDANEVYPCPKCGRKDVHWQALAHCPNVPRIPAPAIGDAGATLKLLEWLWERKRVSLTEEGVWIGDSEEDGEDWFTGPLPLALAAAVLGVKP